MTQATEKAERQGTFQRRFYAATDDGNAARLVDGHGRDLRYVETWGKWLLWDGR